MPKLGVLKHCSGLPLREAAKKKKLGGGLDSTQQVWG